MIHVKFVQRSVMYEFLLELIKKKQLEVTTEC